MRLRRANIGQGNVVRAVKGKPTEADWILRAMIAVAGADGRLDAREVRLIQDVYHDQTGRSVDVSGVVPGC